jgi:hypothetical protein
VLEALCRGAFERDVAAIDRRVAESRGWRIVEATYPILDVVFTHPTAPALRLKLHCEGWDETTPAIDLLDERGAFLSAKPANTGGQFHPGPHPITGRPFVCMRGAREYHTHFSHVSDVWENYRGKPGQDLAGILYQLWRVWKASVG